jgi:hypothetical protein
MKCAVQMWMKRPASPSASPSTDGVVTKDTAFRTRGVCSSLFIRCRSSQHKAAADKHGYNSNKTTSSHNDIPTQSTTRHYLQRFSTVSSPVAHWRKHLVWPVFRLTTTSSSEYHGREQNDPFDPVQHGEKIRMPGAFTQGIPHTQYLVKEQSWAASTSHQLDKRVDNSNKMTSLHNNIPRQAPQQTLLRGIHTQYLVHECSGAASTSHQLISTATTQIKRRPWIICKGFQLFLICCTGPYSDWQPLRVDTMDASKQPLQHGKNIAMPRAFTPRIAHTQYLV